MNEDPSPWRRCALLAHNVEIPDAYSTFHHEDHTIVVAVVMVSKPTSSWKGELGDGEAVTCWQGPRSGDQSWLDTVERRCERRDIGLLIHPASEHVFRPRYKLVDKLLPRHWCDRSRRAQMFATLEQDAEGTDSQPDKIAATHGDV